MTAVVTGEQGAGEKRVVAATVDFFRKGSYTPALAATAPLPGTDCGQSTGGSSRIAQEGGDKGGKKEALGAGGESDTEAVVCMLWLQVRAEARDGRGAIIRASCLANVFGT